MSSYWGLRSYVANSLKWHVNCYKATIKSVPVIWYQSKEHILEVYSAGSPGGTVKYIVFPTCVRHPSRDFSPSSQCLEFLPLQSRQWTPSRSNVSYASSMLSWFGPTNRPLFTRRHRFNSTLGSRLILLDHVAWYLCITRVVYNELKIIFSVFLSRKNNKAPGVDDIEYPRSRPFPACLQIFYWSVLTPVKRLQHFDWISVQCVFVVASSVSFSELPQIWISISHPCGYWW